MRLYLASRELEIIDLLLAGCTNKGIATEFFIGEKTVAFHLNRFYTKIDMNTRVLVSISARQHGSRNKTNAKPISLICQFLNK